MLDPKFSLGQKVKIITLIDGFGRPDPSVDDYVGRMGEIVKSYYVSPDEMWEKVLKLEAVYCYDVHLDGEGEMVRGIPEFGLEAIISKA